MKLGIPTIRVHNPLMSKQDQSTCAITDFIHKGTAGASIYCKKHLAIDMLMYASVSLNTLKKLTVFYKAARFLYRS